MDDTGVFEVTGIGVARWVLGLADLVKAEHVPGIVVTSFSFGLVLLLFWLLIWSRRNRRAISKAIEVVTGEETGDQKKSAQLRYQRLKNFYNRRGDVVDRFGKMEFSNKKSERKLGFAWHEYQDTLVQDDESELMLNGVRPNVFFNLEDLGLETNFFKIFPALFVSLGLACTFFGLIAALQQTSNTLNTAATVVIENPETAADNPLVLDNTNQIKSSGNNTAVPEALQDLLKVASAKFIMSLWGLVCSIFLTFFHRLATTKIYNSVDQLCAEIEKRIRFIGLESLAKEQVNLTREQKTTAQELTTKLIAELGKPLIEEMPKAISKSITETLGPAIDRVGAAGSTGVDKMTKQIGKQFSETISESLGNAAREIEGASSRLSDLLTTLDDKNQKASNDAVASNQHNAEIQEKTANQLKQSAEETRQALQQGVEEMLQQMTNSIVSMNGVMKESAESQKSVAVSLEMASKSIAETLDRSKTDAEKAIVDGANAMSSQIDAKVGMLLSEYESKLAEILSPTIKAASELSRVFRDEVVSPVNQAVESLEEFSTSVKSSTDTVGQYTTELGTGTEQFKVSGEQLSSASNQLANSSKPIAEVTHRLETIVNMSSEVAVQMGKTLDTQHKVLEQSLGSLTESLGQFQDVINRYDDVDEKLGHAFEVYRSSIESSMHTLSQHTGEVHGKFAGAINQLKDVVDQAEKFRAA